MKINTQNKKKKGFTLIEVIAVLVLLGILAAIALPQYLDLTADAENKAIDAGIAELNSREALAWGQAKLQETAATDVAIDVADNLGGDYVLTVDAGVVTQIAFGGATAALTVSGGTEAAPRRYAR